MKDIAEKLKIYLIYQIQSEVLCKASLCFKEILLTKHKLDWKWFM